MKPKTAISLKAAQAVLDKHRRQEQEAKNAESRKLVGRFFKYRNSYSCPQPDEYWWFYVAVESVDEWGGLKGISFQRDHDGKIEIRSDDRVEVAARSGIEITPAEFWREAHLILVAAASALFTEHARNDA